MKHKIKQKVKGVINMSKNIGNLILKILTVIAYLFMIAINILAETVPFNGITTGEVAKLYQNPFTPAVYTFYIWLLIYFLLALYSYYQLVHFNEDVKLYRNIDLLFIISCIANALWIVVWHYQIIILSFGFMIILLICLVYINRVLISNILSKKEKRLVRLPFSIYYGWITVAAIANFAAWMVSLNLYGFLIPESIATVILLLFGAVIGISVMLKSRDVAYGLTILWAYIGILVEQSSAQGYNGEYKSIVITDILCIILITLIIGYVFFKVNKSKLSGVYRLHRR